MRFHFEQPKYYDFACDECALQFQRPEDGDLWIVEFSDTETVSICIRCRQDLGSTEVDQPTK